MGSKLNYALFCFGFDTQLVYSNLSPFLTVQRSMYLPVAPQDLRVPFGVLGSSSSVEFAAVMWSLGQQAHLRLYQRVNSMKDGLVLL
jgi:hypothetical protein